MNMWGTNILGANRRRGTEQSRPSKQRQEG